MADQSKDKHWQLMRRFSDLLDAVDVLNSPPPSSLLGMTAEKTEIDRRRIRTSLVFAALKLMRETLGDYNIADAFNPSGQEPKDLRDDLGWCLTALSAFVPSRGAALGPQPYNLVAVREALEALNVGETRPIFKPAPAPGKRTEAFTLAKHWLQAVGWRAFHKALSGKGGEGYATATVADAYYVGHSTLRGWRSKCAQTLRPWQVERIEQAAAEDANREPPLFRWRVELPTTTSLVRFAGHEIALQEDGEAYRTFLAKRTDTPEPMPSLLEVKSGGTAIEGQ